MLNQKEKVLFKYISGNVNLNNKSKQNKIVKFEKWLNFKKKLLVQSWISIYLLGKKITDMEHLTLQQHCIHIVLLCISKERKDLETAIFSIYSVFPLYSYKHLIYPHSINVREGAGIVVLI